MNSTGGAFAFDLVRLSVLEAELIHDFILRRIELPWAAVYNGENVPPCPLWHCTSGRFYECLVFVKAAAVAPGFCPSGFEVNVDIGSDGSSASLSC